MLWCEWSLPMSEEDRWNSPEDDVMQTMIGKQLRSLYDSVLVEPIPDKIVELLVKLDDVTGANGLQSAKADMASDGESADRK
ncbi:NepR family anti-sigma factor [Acuticoccus kandeliae]|uniref:NepR family anti-sigma factor n=1 Tax=Acuticoccus kandeliae TaxID=2073160 RepID=UPI000D3E5B85|nr:NepR family anti-sigma factor [Acuticoccus kandeliae]